MPGFCRRRGRPAVAVALLVALVCTLRAGLGSTATVEHAHHFHHHEDEGRHPHDEAHVAGHEQHDHGADEEQLGCGCGRDHHEAHDHDHQDHDHHDHEHHDHDPHDHDHEVHGHHDHDDHHHEHHDHDHHDHAPHSGEGGEAAAVVAEEGGCGHAHSHDHHDHRDHGAGHVSEEAAEEEEFSCGCGHAHGHDDDDDHGRDDLSHHGHHHNHNHEAKRAQSWAAVATAFKNNALDTCPWLLAGLTVTVLLQELLELCLPPASVRRYLTLGSGSSSGTAGALFRLCTTAAVLGLATPLCSCGAIPLALALGAAGCAPAAVVAFLTAAQSAGLDSVAITLGVLGWRTALFRLVGALSLSVAAGMAVGRVTAVVPPPTGPTSGDDAADARNEVGEHSPRHRRRPIRTLASRARQVYQLLNETWLVLALGLLATTIAEDRFGVSGVTGLLGLGGDGGGFGGDGDAAASHFSVGGTVRDVAMRLTVILGGLPFQLCEHGVVAFAKALERSGASPGLAQAFLLCAPATNVATLAAVLRSTGNSTAAAVRSALALSAAALVLSYVVDVAAPHELSLVLNNHAIVESFVHLPAWWVRASVWICGGMLTVSLYGKRQQLLKLASAAGLAYLAARAFKGDAEAPATQEL